MHVPNHLTSPESAILGGVVAAVLIGVAISKTRKSNAAKSRIPLAGVLGAFVFAAQMLNIPIADIGFSGHLVGGVLLASMLGPWLGFLTLSGVLAIQALLFADGGIMALGWNIVNMAAIGCLVAYPLVFAPIAKRSTSPARSFGAALAASLTAVVLGSAGVVAEVAASGSALLPAAKFAGFMLTVHLAIGLLEGLISGTIIALVAKREPALLESNTLRGKPLRLNQKRALVGFAVASLLIGGIFSLLSSERPDGLEWSVEKSLTEEPLAYTSEVQQSADTLQQSIAIAPDYAGDYTGLLATAGILLVAWITSPPVRKKEEPFSRLKRE